MYGGSLANIADPEEQGDTGLFKYPHLQLRNVSYSVRRGRREERILDMINIEARGGELVAILATSSKYYYQCCRLSLSRGREGERRGKGGNVLMI